MRRYSRGYFDWLGWFSKWAVLVVILGICTWLILFQMGLAQSYLIRDREEGILTDTEFAQLDTKYGTIGWVCLGAWVILVVAGPIFIVWYGRRKSKVNGTQERPL
jgi:hypothetical protein